MLSFFQKEWNCPWKITCKKFTAEARFINPMNSSKDLQNHQPRRGGSPLVSKGMVGVGHMCIWMLACGNMSHVGGNMSHVSLLRNFHWGSYVCSVVFLDPSWIVSLSSFFLPSVTPTSPSSGTWGSAYGTAASLWAAHCVYALDAIVSAFPPCLCGLDEGGDPAACHCRVDYAWLHLARHLHIPMRCEKHQVNIEEEGVSFSSGFNYFYFNPRPLLPLQCLVNMTF